MTETDLVLKDLRDLSHGTAVLKIYDAMGVIDRTIKLIEELTAPGGATTIDAALQRCGELRLAIEGIIEKAEEVLDK